MTDEKVIKELQEVCKKYNIEIFNTVEGPVIIYVGCKWTIEDVFTFLSETGFY